MIVVDSNIVAYLILPGHSTGLSESVLMKDSVWAAPTLLKSEMRNIFTLYMRQEGLALGATQALMDSVEELFMDRFYSIPSDQILMETHGSVLSAYDAEFVVLARLLEVPLVTWDKQILKAAADVAIRPTEYS